MPKIFVTIQTLKNMHKLQILKFLLYTVYYHLQSNEIGILLYAV